MIVGAMGAALFAIDRARKRDVSAALKPLNEKPMTELTHASTG
jgi:hypothetical protein